MRILVLGSGAREHAIVTALLRESEAAGGSVSSEHAGSWSLSAGETTPRPAHHIIAAPGNAGLAADVEIVHLDATNGKVVTEYALENDIELVVIGPEAPLVAGVADVLRAHSIPVFGPGKRAAALEGSKTFAKRIMDDARVPTGRAVRTGTLAEATTALDEFGAPYVVKADGLAAGKGVLVTDDRDAALEHSRYWLQHGSVLVEEYLEGPEVSLFLVSDGHTVVPLSPAQDFKRLLDGDAGPNTGGMGAYSPLPWLADRFGSEADFVEEVIETIALPTIRQLAKENTPFIGLLYAGLILTEQGIRVIEFNARFGDPETQVVLPRLVSPLSELLLAAANGSLASHAAPVFSQDAAVTVVLASEGYPDAPVTGRPLTGLDEALTVPGVTIAHAATARGEHGLVATGGRVLSVVATGDGFAEARARAYEALSKIELEGGQYRHDIAEKVAR